MLNSLGLGLKILDLTASLSIV